MTDKQKHQKIIVAWGGGTNSTAMLIGMARRSIRPDLILFADPGHEWPHTYAYRDEVMRPWLKRVGFPDVVTVKRSDRKTVLQQTLGEEMERRCAIPSVGYPRAFKTCSDNYKQKPQQWYIESLQWAKDEWANGRKIRKAIGFDLDERHRVLKNYDSNECENWYPLVEWGMGRDECKSLIASEGLRQPGKSSCFFCPNNKRHEWERLRDEHPDLFAYAVAMDRRAVLESDAAGLMRSNQAGKRRLHKWADGEYDKYPLFERENDMPCGCMD